MIRVSAKWVSASRSDATDAISGPCRPIRREPLHRSLELLGIVGKAQAQIALPGSAERRAGRKPDAGFVDETQREAARVVLPLDGEEHVEGALRPCETAAARRGEPVAHDSAALARPCDLMLHEAFPAFECGHDGTLHELRDAGGRRLRRRASIIIRSSLEQHTCGKSHSGHT